MHIALLTYSTKPRGGVIHAMYLAEAIQALDQSICLFALSKSDDQFCRPLACNYQLVPAQPAPQNTEQLIQQRIQEYVDYFWQHPQTYDIYHAQDCLSANALIQLRQQGYSIPKIIRTVHHIEDYHSPYLQECQDKSIRLVDQCFCVSRYWQQELQRVYDITAPLVFNGVDVTRFRPPPNQNLLTLREHFGLTGDPIFLTIGGIEPRKNSLRLLLAFAQVKQQLPQAQLVIGGGLTLFDYHAYQAEFFQAAENLGIEPGRELLLLGPIADADLPSLYHCADAFVFPSLKEGWGLVVMEAIAAGIPVLTANQPPFTEFLTREQAYLVNVNDRNAIAQGMIDMLKPNTSKNLIQKSQTILPTYTWLNSAKQHLQIYQSN